MTATEPSPATGTPAGCEIIASNQTGATQTLTAFANRATPLGVASSGCSTSYRLCRPAAAF